MLDLLASGLNGLTTLVAAFGGFLLAGWNQRRTDERAAARERAQHARDVSTRLADERHRDQLELLRTVQEDVQRAVRATIRVLTLEQTLREEGGDDSAMPAGVRLEVYETRMTLALHASRVLDERVRAGLAALLKDLTEIARHSFVLLDENLPDTIALEARVKLLDIVSGQNQALLETIGDALRAEAAWDPVDASGDKNS